uniref:BD-FAE-like domain-containing protein n=1 Tax=Pseudo-nitzschia australis TaxID=44445 RepID=A0A7S4ABY1_9STRA
MICYSVTRHMSLTDRIPTSAKKIVVVIPDLRNYPLVCIPSMVDDVDLALDWTRKNIAQYGGDPTNIVVVGQSAGGHVACMAIFRKIRRKIAREDGIVSLEGFTGTNRDGNGKNIHANGNSNCEWMASDLKGFAAVSSPLNLGSIINESFRRLGFDNGMVDRMFGFEKKTYDPFLALEEFQSAELKHKFVKEFPPICIYQGTSDKTVPYECSESFYRELLRTTSDKQSVSFVSYDGWSHTDPILEGPMDADHRLHKDLFNNVNEWITSPNLTWPNDARINDRLCPHFMIEISRMINPF